MGIRYHTFRLPLVSAPSFPKPPPTRKGWGLFQIPPETPYHKSQPLFQKYESILPTSLTHIILFVRGYLPRRPDAVISTLGPDHHILPRVFNGRCPNPEESENRPSLQRFEPRLALNAFEGPAPLQIEQIFLPEPVTDVLEFDCVATINPSPV